MKKISLIILLCVALSASAQKNKTENVILITLDGMRWQEVFEGADLKIIRNR